MGVDLDFIVCRKSTLENNTRQFSIFHDAYLYTNRDYALQEKIRALSFKEILPVALYKYQDNGLEEIKKDGYGKPLEYLPAGDIGALLGDDDLKDVSLYNLAVLTFLKYLGSGHIVVLYWH